MILFSRCKRYSKLINESEDRPLSPSERQFVDLHAEDCSKCAALSHATAGLNMLRMCAIEPDDDSSFEHRVLRKVLIGRKRSTLAYWSPAVIGAAIACVTILAALQLISRPSQLPMFGGQNVESRRLDHGREPLFPVLDNGSIRSNSRVQ